MKYKNNLEYNHLISKSLKKNNIQFQEDHNLNQLVKTILFKQIMKNLIKQ